jgi:cullin 3
VKLVENSLNKEIERVNEDMDHSTELKITEIVENELIKRNLKIIIHEMEIEGVIFMLEFHKSDDLELIYTLFSRVNRGLEVLGERISGYIRDKIQNSILVDRNPIIAVQVYYEYLICYKKGTYFVLFFSRDC